MSSPQSPTDEQIAEASSNSLVLVGGGYVVTEDGQLEYAGERPGRGWHGHGWFERWLWILVDGVPQRQRLRKHRWILVGTTTTMHSRPPDEWGAVHFCLLIVLLKLWPWLSGSDGLHNTSDLSHKLAERPSTRTMQRWLERLCAQSMELQQAIRSALIERCEPRPVEQLFPRGLSPPESLTRRRWKEPEPVSQLHRALTMLFAGAVKLSIPTAALLAEARRR